MPPERRGTSYSVMDVTLAGHRSLPALQSKVEMQVNAATQWTTAVKNSAPVTIGKGKRKSKNKRRNPQLLRLEFEMVGG